MYYFVKLIPANVKVLDWATCTVKQEIIQIFIPAIFLESLQKCFSL